MHPFVILFFFLFSLIYSIFLPNLVRVFIVGSDIKSFISQLKLHLILRQVMIYNLEIDNSE